MKCFKYILLWTGFAAALGTWAETQVDAAQEPGAKWSTFRSRTLEDVSGKPLPPDVLLDSYGGLSSKTAKATGFFHAKKIVGRWWLVDPDGGLYIHKGMVSVSMLHSDGAKAALNAKMGDELTWAAHALELLKDHGFNGLGAWSDTPRLTAAQPRMAYTLIWNFMSNYGKKRGGTFKQSGHMGYPGDCMFLFDPEFETFCDEHAKQLSASKDDPWLLGHFSDNELPFKSSMLDHYLALPEADAGHKAAAAWLEARLGHGAHKEITAAERSAFLSHCVDTYCRIVATAIKKYDPNHMFLGPRFHGGNISQPEVFKAAGAYLDAVAVNYYRAWSPDLKKLEMWEQQSGKPCIISEWYAKGVDSGLTNKDGFGWLVKTQRERGLFYQNFTLGLLQSKVCVGWHWFKYTDNDPEDNKADASNRDANKGIVNNRYEPYVALLSDMQSINERVYGLIDIFDKPKK